MLDFALLPQVNFPANNLNFHWRWRDGIQDIFLNIFYFNQTNQTISNCHIASDKNFCSLTLKRHKVWEIGKCFSDWFICQFFSHVFEVYENKIFLLKKFAAHFILDLHPHSIKNIIFFPKKQVHFCGFWTPDNNTLKISHMTYIYTYIYISGFSF